MVISIISLSSNSNLILHCHEQRSSLGRSVSRSAEESGGRKHIQAHRHRQIRLEDAGTGTGGEHEDHSALFLEHVHPHGSVLRGDVHDDRLGAQQAVAGSPREHFCGDGHGCSVWPLHILGRRFHRPEFGRTVPHDR